MYGESGKMFAFGFCGWYLTRYAYACHLTGSYAPSNPWKILVPFTVTVVETFGATLLLVRSFSRIGLWRRFSTLNVVLGR